MVSTPNQLSKTLASFGLQRVQPDIERLMLASIRLTSTPAAGPIPPGSSRLGGEPDLPAAFTWPAWRDTPMSFLAQIRLDELAAFPAAGVLPKTGLLSFFYDADQETYGADPSDRGGWQVVHFKGKAESWKRRAFPEALPEAARFSTCLLSFSSEVSLPSSPEQHLPSLNWSEAEVEGYEDFFYTYPSMEDRGTLHHRMLGHPDQLQDDMQLQCALYANGYNSLGDPNAAEALARKEDWLLLLQLDSDYQVGMKWASSGRLYFWIESPALHAGQFERCWAVLQSD